MDSQNPYLVDGFLNSIWLLQAEGPMPAGSYFSVGAHFGVEEKTQGPFLM